MKKLNIIVALSLSAFAIVLFYLTAETSSAQMSSKTNTSALAEQPTSKVDFEAFEKLTKEVKEYRKSRLVDLETFLKFSKEKNTIILDTRSEKMFRAKHVKRAINLNFSDFTQSNLAQVISTKEIRILIYCNTNFMNDEIHFNTKVAIENNKSKEELTLALNIPTFINLYGYGYKNVYELSELISLPSGLIEFEGTSVAK